jgi:hypothetical protein
MIWSDILDYYDKCERSLEVLYEGVKCKLERKRCDNPSLLTSASFIIPVGLCLAGSWGRLGNGYKWKSGVPWNHTNIMIISMRYSIKIEHCAQMDSASQEVAHCGRSR